MSFIQPFETITMAPFADKAGWEFAGYGIKQLVDPGVNTNVDYLVPAISRFNGTQIILKNHFEEDQLMLQIGYYNPLDNGNFVLVRPLSKFWNVITDRQDQGQTVLSYGADLPSQTVLRIVYMSKGLSQVLVKANHFLHKAVAVV